MPTRRSARALLALLTAACTFKSALPAGTIVHCDSAAAPCPTGSTCQVSIGQCIDDSLLTVPPASIVNAALAPAYGNAKTDFTLDFEVTRALHQTPVATATSLGAAGSASSSYPFQCQPCSSSLHCHCDWTPTGPPPQGALLVSVSVVDVSGNTPPPTSVGSVVYDTIPPTLAGPPTVELTAPPGIDTTLAELGNGVSAKVCFAVDEPLQSSPSVWAGADAGLVFGLLPGWPQGLSYCYQATLEPGLVFPDGPLPAAALATDLAGNSSLFDLSSTTDGGALLWVDRTPPASPDLSGDGGLHYHRAPWGELPTIGRPRAAVVSAGAALAKPGTIIAYSDSTESTELGRTLVEDGPVDLELSSYSQPEVWVDEVDLAGNRLAGGPVKVSHVDWVANLGLKIRGDLTSNPHDCYARPQAGPTLVEGDDPTTDLAASDGPVGGDAGGTLVVGAAGWRARSKPATFLYLQQAYAYDPAHGIHTEFDSAGTVGTFDGLDWTTPPSATQPGPAELPGMSFDQARGEVVLFGGCLVDQQNGITTSFCDTWTESAVGWSDLACATVADGGVPSNTPAGRYYQCQAYDPARQTTVIVGGISGSLLLNTYQVLTDMWQWDGTGWTPLSSTLPYCIGPMMVYDDGLDGGAMVTVQEDSDGTNYTFVGVWDGGTYNWTEGPELPVGLTPQALTLDLHTGLLATLVTDGSNVPQVWTWDGSASGWILAGTPPYSTARNLQMGSIGIAQMPDQGDGQTLMVLISQQVNANATPVYVISRCSLDPFQCSAISAPDTATVTTATMSESYGELGGLAYDEQGRGLLTGAPVAPGPLETWSWEGGDWSIVTGSAPPARFDEPLGYWPPTGEFWLIGGSELDGGLATDFWTFTFEGGWAYAGPNLLRGLPGGSPPTVASIPDAGLDGLLTLVPGGGLALVSRVDAGLAISRITSQSPDGYMAYDPNREVLVMTDSSGEIFEASPPLLKFNSVISYPFADGVLSYDPPSASMLMVGGFAANNALPPLGQVLRWDGSSLTALPLADPDNDGNPQQYNVASMAYDPFNRRTRQVNVPGPLLPTQTWELELADTRPGLACHFRFAGAEAPPSSSLTGIVVTADASALGPDGGATEALLAIWHQGEWRPVQTCTGSACQALTYSVAGGSTSQLLEDLDTLGVEVTPSASNGNGLAQVQVRSLQATFSYELP